MKYVVLGLFLYYDNINQRTLLLQSEVEIKQNIKERIQSIETMTKTLEQVFCEIRNYADYDRSCFIKNFKQLNNSVKCLDTTITSLDQKIKEIADEMVNLENKLVRTGNDWHVQSINLLMTIAEDKPIFDGSRQSFYPIRFLRKLE
ncbi:hypothetical protein FQA39_LY12155 [Lamprigera yunnana]|nr:hypothetical protein FQA39_LY12155 [Lamprigera yunnana]